MKKLEYNDNFKIIFINKNTTTITPSHEALPLGPLYSLESHVVTIQSLQFTSPQQLVNLKATVKSM